MIEMLEKCMDIVKVFVVLLLKSTIFKWLILAAILILAGLKCKKCITQWIEREERKETRRKIEYVKATSPRYIAETKLNREFWTKAENQINQRITLVRVFRVQINSEWVYDHIDFDKELRREVKKHLAELLPYVEPTKHILEIEGRYYREYKKLPPFMTQGEFFRRKLSGTIAYPEYSEIEESLSYDYPEAHMHNWYGKVEVYTADKNTGRHKMKSRTYDKKAMVDCIEAVQKGIEFSSEQRKLMNPKLRYSILKRDGFRCVLCGRGVSDGVRLEVDHYLPVFWGGHTTKSNLRCLCSECNIGKANSFDYLGLN